MLVVGVVACQEETPTGLGDEVSGAPITIEVELPWSEFASNLEVFGGYGLPSEVGDGIIATNLAGLNARTLVRFGSYPDRATVRDSSGTNRTDSTLAIFEGLFVAHFDAAASTNTGPVTLSLGALQTEWHAGSAGWTLAVDTLNDSRAWPDSGAGPVTPLRTAAWDPASADSVLFFLDSAQIAAWADTTDQSRGARLELVTEGERLRMSSASLRLSARPSIDPDTVVELVVPSRSVTFVYDPRPGPPAAGVRVGGAPSWRSVLDIALPTTLTGPPAFCAAVGCPHTLQAGEISFGALVLTSEASDTAFQPRDSLSVDVRPVLQRAAMPKAPLGSSLIGTPLGRRVAGAAFGSQPGARFEVPITSFLRALVVGQDESGRVAPNTLALLAAIEPSTITYASFVGPGATGEPVLRLVLTIGPPVELP